MLHGFRQFLVFVSEHIFDVLTVFIFLAKFSLVGDQFVFLAFKVQHDLAKRGGLFRNFLLEKEVLVVQLFVDPGEFFLGTAQFLLGNNQVVDDLVVGILQ